MTVADGIVRNTFARKDGLRVNLDQKLSSRVSLQVGSELIRTTSDRGLFGTGFLRDWARQLEIGFSGASGTTDSLSLNAQANASISNDIYRATIGLGYFLEQSDGVIGRKKEQILARFLTQMPAKFEMAEGDIQLHGVVIDIDDKTGKADSIKRIQKKLDA